MNWQTMSVTGQYPVPPLKARDDPNLPEGLVDCALLLMPFWASSGFVGNYMSITSTYRL